MSGTDTVQGAELPPLLLARAGASGGAPSVAAGVAAAAAGAAGAALSQLAQIHAPLLIHPHLQLPAAQG